MWKLIETAPRTGRVILWPGPYLGQDPIIGGYASAHAKWFGDNEVLKPTHWMPMPNPPISDSAQSKGPSHE